MSARYVCRIDGCGKPSDLPTVCRMHYQRLRKHGSLDKPVHHRIKDEVGYAAMHARLNRADKVSNYRCACGCGQPA